MSMLDALKYQNMARNDPGEYYRQTPIMRAAAERNLGGWLGQAYDQDIKPAYDAWTPQVSDLYNAPKTIAQALGGAVKDNTDTLNAAAPLAMAGDDEAMAQAAKASFDLASMYGGSTAAASLAGGVPRGAVLGAHVFQGGPHKYGPEGASESLKHMSKGEGAQAYGYGRYDAGNVDVASNYRKNLSNDVFMERDGRVFEPRELKHLNVRMGLKRHNGDIDALLADPKIQGIAERQGITDVSSGRYTPTETREMFSRDMAVLADLQSRGGLTKTDGYLYKHDLPDEDIARYLDYDAPLSEQPESVRKALAMEGVGQDEFIPDTAMPDNFDINNPDTWDTKMLDTGADVSASGDMMYERLVDKYGSKQAASEALAKAGIPGLKYYDGMSRGQVGGATATNIRERIAGAEASNSNLRKAIEDGDLGPGNDPHKMQLAKGEAEVRGWQKELAQHDSNATRNYVTWDQEVLDRMKLLERNNEDMTKALMQK